MHNLLHQITNALKCAMHTGNAITRNAKFHTGKISFAQASIEILIPQHPCEVSSMFNVTTSVQKATFTIQVRLLVLKDVQLSTTRSSIHSCVVRTFCKKYFTYVDLQCPYLCDHCRYDVDIVQATVCIMQLCPQSSLTYECSLAERYSML